MDETSEFTDLEASPSNTARLWTFGIVGQRLSRREPNLRIIDLLDGSAPQHHRLKVYDELAGN